MSIEEKAKEVIKKSFEANQVSTMVKILEEEHTIDSSYGQTKARLSVEKKKCVEATTVADLTYYR